MPKDFSRPSLPTSSSDFALPPSSSPGGSFSSLDDPNLLLHRIRRPSLLQRSHHSPLAANPLSFHARRRSQSILVAEESESERERMSTDSPSSSENHTPPLKSLEHSEEDVTAPKPKPSRMPLTPPRRRSSASMDSDMPTIFNRRLNFPLKQPRILKLLSEPRPEEDEVKSEAAFQRLIHSSSEIPRTPRPFIDRGRYPEEAGHEEERHRDATPSDDELEIDDIPFAYSAPNATQPINIRGMKTPSGSVAGSVNGDDLNMSQSETPSSSYGAAAMDVDMAFGSPLLSSMPPAMPSNSNSWRYTPPPTASAVRSNKRKLDDRFDPYPTSSKRRAVSPSLHYLNRDNHSTTNSPIGRPNGSRLPIAIPISIPASAVSSAASSPTISGAYSHYPRIVSNTSSPTMRSAPMLLASPIIRPIPRRRIEGEERDVENTGQGVRGLRLGE